MQQPQANTKPIPQQEAADEHAAVPRVAKGGEQIELMWKRLTWFWVVYGTGWFLVLGYYGWVASILRYQWPHDTFLFQPSHRFSDLTISWEQGKAANPYADNGTGFAAAHFPFEYLIYRSIAGLSREVLLGSYLVVSYAAVVGVWLLWLRKHWAQWRGDSRRGVMAMLSLGIVVCNYPLIFSLDRGNIDPLTMALLYAAFVLAIGRRKIASGLVLALASASKAFPIAAVLLLIRRRAVLGALVAVCGFAALVLLPATAFEGDWKATLRGLQAGMGVFRTQYVLGPLSCHYSFDWLNAIRSIVVWRNWRVDIAAVVPAYERVMLLWAGSMALLALSVVREIWRELLAIILIMLVFPNVANDYKLVLLIPVILEWFLSDTRGWRNGVFLVAAALLMLPKHFWFLVESYQASVSCVLNPLLITVMSAVLWPTAFERHEFVDLLKDWRKRMFGISSVAGSK